MRASDGQRREIDAIVQAVQDGHEWRVDLLLDRFVLGADLPALLALREALEKAAPGRQCH
ncbi:hypothetical protein [Streptomyces sp. A5-4]|uniref:hypothetical protein n=1 Tax=Streptomyces sp. A5-4 TaxID=3384771 RepID=UPI003DA99604